MQRLIFIFIVMLFSIVAQAQQPLSNNGGLISIKGGAFMSVHGDVINSNNGIFHNSDTIYLFEDWVNNAGNEAFTSQGEGVVILKSANQRIQGTDITRFYDLRLEGTGIKYGDLDVYVDGFLRLNDREFNLNTNTVHVFNTSTSAVTQQGGFVSSLQSGGLLRHMDVALPYSFPVGSSLGTTRFRPVDLQKATAGSSTFKVRMANVDATTEGYDRAIRDSSICEINPTFYHRIYDMQGGDSAKVKIHFIQAADGVWDSIAHWQNDPKWEITGDVTSGTNPAYLQTFLESSNFITDFTHPAFALASVADSLNLQVVSNPVCDGETFTFTADSGFLNYDFYVNDALQQSGPDSVFVSILNDGDEVQAVIESADCIYYSRTITAQIFMNSIVLNASMNSACTYETITFTGSTGFLNYDFLVNGISVQSSTSAIYMTSALNDGDVVSVIGTDANCDYESNSIPITIYQNQVDLTVDQLIACEGENFNFTATAGFFNYDFQINGVSAQNGSLNTFSTPLADLDNVHVIATDANCDYESDSIQVNLFMNTVDLSVDMLIACAGDPFTFTASSGFNTYEFFINGGLAQTGTNNIFTSTGMLDGDQVSVHATDNNCTYISDTITVNLHQATLDLTMNILGFDPNYIPSEFCLGDTLIFTATEGFTNYDFYVNFALVQSGSDSTYITDTLSTLDIVFVIASDANCTYQSNQIQVFLFFEALLLESSTTQFCEGGPITFTASPPQPFFEFWVNGVVVQSDTSNTYTTADLMDGDSVKVSGFGDHCGIESNVIYINYNTQSVQLQSSAPGVCAGSSIDFTASPGFENYEFQVNDITQQTGTSNIFITTDFADGDSIQVIASTTGCDFPSNTLLISVFPEVNVQASTDTTIFEGTSVTLEATGADFYTWTPGGSLSCDDCASPVATPDSTTLYTVLGESLEGCLDTASVFVMVLPIDNGGVVIPNAFTPNGDGKNDTWHISYLDAFPDNEVVVLNRWGDKLYSGKPYIDEFDGTFQGKPLPRGTYYFILNVVVNGENQTFKGPLTIVY